MIVEYLISNRRAAGAVGLSAILLLAVLSYPLFIKKEQKVTNKIPAINISRNDITAKKVFIKRDLQELGGDTLSDNVWNSIEHTLYAMGQGTTIKDLYTGTIQPGSYSHDLSYTPDGNKRTKSFRVDIEPSRMTYTVFIVERNGNWFVDTSCAPKEFQIDQSVTCKEVDWI